MGYYLVENTVVRESIDLMDHIYTNSRSSEIASGIVVTDIFSMI